MRLKSAIQRRADHFQHLVRYWLKGAPLPPPELHFLITGNENLDENDFLEIGRGCAQGLLQTLCRNGVDTDRLRAVLDFGCGCGRVLRHLIDLKRAKLHGTDCNVELIEWCRANLPFARFEVNRIEPPLVYADEQFDLVYAYSVFTHLPEALQVVWINEVSRVLRSGGHLLITTQGEAYADHYLSPKERMRFDSGELVVQGEGPAGTFHCGAFHPRSYVQETLAQRLEIVEFGPGKVHDMERRLIGQDTYLLRKPRPA